MFGKPYCDFLASVCIVDLSFSVELERVQPVLQEHLECAYVPVLEYRSAEVVTMSWLAVSAVPHQKNLTENVQKCKEKQQVVGMRKREKYQLKN